MLQSYPEFARQLLYESNMPEFVEATAEWERAYGKASAANHASIACALQTADGQLPCQLLSALQSISTYRVYVAGGTEEACAAVSLHGGHSRWTCIREAYHAISTPCQSHVRHSSPSSLFISLCAVCHAWTCVIPAFVRGSS